MTFKTACQTALTTLLILGAGPAAASVVQLNFSGELEASYTPYTYPELVGATLSYSIMFDTADGPTYTNTYTTQTNAGYAGTANVSITNLSGGAADILQEDLTVNMAIRNYYGADDIWDIVEFSIYGSNLAISNHQWFPGAFATLDDFDEITFLTDGTIDTSLFTNTSLSYGGAFSSDSFNFVSTEVTSGAVSAVPLPPALLLSLGSLGALMGLRRKRLA